jgi:ribose 5-phosphate isomerase RpiB
MAGVFLESRNRGNELAVGAKSGRHELSRSNIETYLDHYYRGGEHHEGSIARGDLAV